MRRFALGVLLGSVALNAALGIYALLAAEFGDVEGRILFTSLSMTGSGVLALACAPAWEGGRLAPVPAAGVTASFAGFALLAAAVWNEFEAEPLWRSAWTLVIAAAACAHASLLALAALAPRYRWAFPATLALGFGLAALAVSAVWGEWSADWFYRWLGVVAVLLGAFTVAVPILHRASRGRLAGPGRPAEAAGFCQRCGRPVSGEAREEAACASCGARFSVRFLP